MLLCLSINVNIVLLVTRVRLVGQLAELYPVQPTPLHRNDFMYRSPSTRLFPLFRIHCVQVEESALEGLLSSSTSMRQQAQQNEAWWLFNKHHDGFVLK